MGIVAVDIDTLIHDVTHGENVELLLSSATRSVDWKQNRPGDASAQKAHNDHHLEEAHK